MKIEAFVLVAAASASTVALADEELSRRPHMVVSSQGTILLKTFPTGPGRYEGEGTAFRLEADGKLRELWRINFYAEEVILSDDGHQLVRFPSFPRRGEAERRKQLVLAFYKDGRLLRSYVVEDLIKDFTHLSCTVSHFQWVALEPPSAAPMYRLEEFTIVTLDGQRHYFNPETGALLRSERAIEVPTRYGSECFGQADWTR